MKISSFLIGLSLILLPQAVFSLTLEQLQQSALANRALVKKYETEIEKSSEDLRITKSGYYPSLDVGYKAWGLDESSSTEQRENSAFIGSISWNLFAGFKDKYSISSAKIIQQVETTRLNAIEQDIQLAVALRYLAAYNQKARLKVAMDRNKTLENLYLDSNDRFEVGLLDKNTVLKFKVDFANADLSVKREEAILIKTVHQLSREVNQEIQRSELDFNEFQTTPVLKNTASYEERMLNNRSELKILEQLADSAEARVKAQYSGYYPRLDLSGSYRDYEDSYLNGQGDLTEDELRAELTLSLNLFSGFSDEASIAKAKANVRSINYDYAELQNSMKTGLKNLFVDYEIGLANVEIALEDITYAKENLRITELKYKEGLQRQLDLLDAVANLTRAQSNYVNVIKTVFENYYQIIRMIEGFPKRG